jgi:hypothetical protein
VYIFIGVQSVDSPKEDLYNKDKDIYKFIESTPKNAIYAVSYPGNFRFNIPNIANRAVVAGNGFPFNELYFNEYQERKERIYGNREQLDKIEGSGEDEKISKFFRKLKPKDFIDISLKFKLDYIVIETEYAQSFDDYKTVFENKKVKIYKIVDLKESN